MLISEKAKLALVDTIPKEILANQGFIGAADT